MEGGGKFQMDNVPLQERMWGAGDIKIAVRRTRMLLMGGGW